jgi:hypothetical protein
LRLGETGSGARWASTSSSTRARSAESVGHGPFAHGRIRKIYFSNSSAARGPRPAAGCCRSRKST